MLQRNKTDYQPSARAYKKKLENKIVRKSHSKISFLHLAFMGSNVSNMYHLVFRIHALKRMRQRHIHEEEIRSIVAEGEVIEDYPDTFPFPCRLVIGWCGNRCLHVVAAENTQAQEIIIITAYEPNHLEWEPDLKRRKS